MEYLHYSLEDYIQNMTTDQQKKTIRDVLIRDIGKEMIDAI